MFSSRWTPIVKFAIGPLWILFFAKLAWSVPRDITFDSVRSSAPTAVRWLAIAIWIVVSAGILRFTLPLKRVEVRDDRIIVSNYFREWEISPREIADVRQNRWVNGRPIRVQLRHEVDALGSAFMFMPSTLRRRAFWRESPEVNELRMLAETLRTVSD